MAATDDTASVPPEQQEYEPVDPNAIPPSYNPEAVTTNNASNNTNQPTQTSQPQTVDNYNAGDMYGHPLAVATPNDIPYNTTTNIVQNPPIPTDNYNTGNMYGQTPQYASEGQISFNQPPQDLPPSDYQTVTSSSNMTQPLISSNIANHHSTNNYYKSRNSNCDCDKCKQLLLYGACFWCIAMVILIIGSVWLNSNLRFSRNSQETQCTIQSYTSTSCTYDCNCYKDKDGNKHCDTCYGEEYKYYVTSPLCNGDTLHQSSWTSNGGCPQSFKSIGYTSNCWVECNKSEFSFTSPTEMIAWSIVLLVVGGCCCCCGTGFACNKGCCDRFA